MHEVIVDSAMTLEEGLRGSSCPSLVKETLSLIDVRYLSFDGRTHQGQLIVHTAVADEMREIFAKLLELQFPIHHVTLPVVYDWNDDAIMAANATSAFNYRCIQGTDVLSKHSYGFAIDINPVQNPYTQRDGVIVPPGAVYDPTKPGTLTKDGLVVTLFKTYGWEWGGDWERKDWQHFEKPHTL